MDILSIVCSVITILSFIGMICEWLYYHRIKFYVFINRFVNQMREVSFEINGTFRINKQQDVFADTECCLKKIYQLPVIRKEMNLSNSKMYSLDNFMMAVQLDTEINADIEKNEVYIHFPKIIVTYKSAESILEEVEKIFEAIVIKMGINEKTYSLNVRYNNNYNPFYGFVIQRFGKKAVKSFSCQLDCESLFKNSNINSKCINIYKDYVNVTDENFGDIRRTSKYILMLK